jgi:hypothetical protein
VPVEVDAVLARALTKNPAERYEDICLFTDALEVALDLAPASCRSAR